jgi:NAD(P)-dependent dehydrogenase (short-subunit alcohol dehydrogenase family)
VKGLEMTKLPHENADNGEPKKFSRRHAITAGGIAASAVAVSSFLGSDTARAQDGAARSSRGELAGKSAFITGGARGIGLAIAEELAKAGANIALYDIASGTAPNVPYPISTANDLQAAKAKIEALGVRCLTFRGDVRDKDAQAQAMQQTAAAFNTLEFSAQEITAVLEINVGGVIKTTQAAAPIMKRQRSGRIIYISSALGRMGNELFPVYTSSKWAVIGFAKSAALTYGSHNVLCNVVAPGLVRTPLADNDYVMQRMMPNDPDPDFDRFSRANAGNSPIGVGHLEAVDVAKAVLFFTGEATSKVTGEVFDISYGSLARSIA